jgi:hypothetical protein
MRQRRQAKAEVEIIGRSSMMPYCRIGFFRSSVVSASWFSRNGAGPSRLHDCGEKSGRKLRRYAFFVISDPRSPRGFPWPHGALDQSLSRKPSYSELPGLPAQAAV